MPSDKRQSRLVASLAVIAVICAVLLPCKSDAADDNSLWGAYEQALKGAKYVCSYQRWAIARSAPTPRAPSSFSASRS